jgi:signal peptidase II
VVDFLDLHWFNRVHWPTFNLADTAICIGVGLIFLDLIFQPGKSGIDARTK